MNFIFLDFLYNIFSYIFLKRTMWYITKEFDGLIIDRTQWNKNTSGAQPKSRLTKHGSSLFELFETALFGFKTFISDFYNLVYIAVSGKYYPTMWHKITDYERKRGICGQPRLLIIQYHTTLPPVWTQCSLKCSQF